MDTLSYKTLSANKESANKKWWVVDVEGKILGRCASKIAKVLRGKYKTNFTPHADCGDYVIVINSENIFNVPNYLIALILLIVIRPIIGWCISFFQISMILKILRNLEDEITEKCKNSFENDDKNFSSETSANMLISHGRYFVDNYLIPLIRATTDLGTIIVIAIGLFIQFPIPLVFFIGAAFISLSSYQLLSKGFCMKKHKFS